MFRFAHSCSDGSPASAFLSFPFLDHLHGDTKNQRTSLLHGPWWEKQTWFKRKPFFHQLDGGTKNQRLPLLHGIMMEETFQTWLKRKPFLLIDDGFQHP